MDASGARWLAGSENQFTRIYNHTIEVITEAASKGSTSVVLKKYNPDVTILLKQSLEKKGYTVRVGVSLFKDRGRLVVSW